MNLTEAIVAASVFLGACSSAAQLGVASTAAISQSQRHRAALEQSEAQFLAVAPALRDADRPAVSCAVAAQWMQQQLAAALPPLPQGMTRALALNSSGDQLELAIGLPDGWRRVRLLNPAAYGLCPAIDPPPVASHATL